MDKDGYPDIVIHYSYFSNGTGKQDTYVFLNKGDGRYTDQKTFYKAEAFSQE